MKAVEIFRKALEEGRGFDDSTLREFAEAGLELDHAVTQILTIIDGYTMLSLSNQQRLQIAGLQLSALKFHRLVEKEMQRQIKKWGVQRHEPLKWVAILTEEVGEVAKATLENKHSG